MAEDIAGVAHRYWEAVMRHAPTYATFLGDHRFDDRIEDLSEEADAERRSELVAIRQEAEALDRAGLTTAERVTRSMLLGEIDNALLGIDLRLVELGANHMTGPHAELLMVLPQLTFPEPEQAEAVLRRFEQVGTHFDQALNRFRAGLAAGRTPTAIAINRSISMLEKYLEGPVDEDPFLAVQLPPGWDGADAWRQRAAAIVADTIRPATQRYLDAFRHEFAPVARPDDQAGLCWLPDGEELYAGLILLHTSLSLPAQQIHDLGRRHTEERLPLEFAEIGGRHLGADGFEAVLQQLRTDPAMRHTSEQEIIDLAESTVSRAADAVEPWFGRLPQARCRVERVPEMLAADAPYAYYFPPAPDGSRPGTYFVNASDPADAVRYEGEAIAYHEAIPGHHLQIAISQELEGLPEFQKHSGSTSYVEGWALYAERLADEMGLYSGDLDRLGMLSADSWRSARLVVDTGLHALRWSRQQALDYFAQWTPTPSEVVAMEIDRYIAMPGQALAYKLGQQEIFRLRDRARHALNARYDVRDFHDAVLGSGAVTLPVLGEVVEEWITASR